MYTLGGYNGSAVLSDSTALLALVGLTVLGYEEEWLDWDDGYEIQEALSLALYEVMTTMPATFAVGQIITSVSTTQTPGTLICNGQRYNRVDYPELYAVLPGDLIIDADTFDVPQLNASYLRGYIIPEPIGSTGGENSVELLEKHLPAITAVNPGGQPNVEIGNGFGLEFPVDGGTPHNNQPKHVNVRFEIITGK